MPASITGGQAVDAKGAEWLGSVLPKVQIFLKSTYVKVISIKTLLASWELKTEWLAGKNDKQGKVQVILNKCFRGHSFKAKVIQAPFEGA